MHTYIDPVLFLWSESLRRQELIEAARADALAAAVSRRPLAPERAA